jgi:hypothetical protein
MLLYQSAHTTKKDRGKEMIYIAILVAVAVLAYVRGFCKGMDEAEVHTDYWHKQSMDYMQRWLDAIKDDPDDDDGAEIPEEVVEAEPIKAMAKGAGA